MKGSGPKGFSRVRPNREVLPVEEDRSRPLYAEGIENFTYRTEPAYPYSIAAKEHAEAAGHGDVHDFGEQVMVRGWLPGLTTESLQWSHDGVRFYDLPGEFYRFWPHVYDTDRIGLYSGTPVLARYWRAYTTDYQTGAASKRWIYATHRDPNVLLDGNDCDYADLDDSDFGLTVDVQHIKRILNIGRYFDFGTCPDMILTFMNNIEYEAPNRFWMTTHSEMCDVLYNTTDFKAKYQIVQRNKRGITIGRNPWGDGSASEELHPMHLNFFTWGGFDLASFLFSAWAFKNNAAEGVTVRVAAPGTTRVEHGLGAAPDLVYVGKAGPSENSTAPSFDVWMIASQPDYYYTEIVNSTPRRDRGVYEVDDRYVYFPVSLDKTFVLCINNRSSKTINSHVGTYTGNGSASGPSVNVGFRPHLTMTFRAEATGGGSGLYWVSASDCYSLSLGGYLSSYSGYLTQTATGFDISNANSVINENGITYFYWCLSGYEP